jgi:uncharacterized integral membrane protein
LQSDEGGRITETPPTAPCPPTASEPGLTGPVPRRPSGRTRVSTVWVGIVIANLLLVLLIVFILENTKSVGISYFGAHWSMPLGVALLLATVGGVLLAGIVASLRILQLHHRLRNRDQSAASGHKSRFRRKPKAV